MSVFRLRQILTADEGSFMENFNSPGSISWSKNLPILDATFEMPHEREMDTTAQSRIAKRGMSHIGAHQPGTLTIRMNYGGHGGTAAGSLTETALQQLIGDGLRGNDTSIVGTTIAGTSSTTTSIDVATTANLGAGDIVRIGVKGDARGEGQAHVIGVITDADTFTVLNAVNAAPTTAGDVVYGTQMAYFDEDATQTYKSFAVLHAGTGEQWVLSGCEMSNIRVTYPIGQKPEAEVTYRVADYQRSAISFPNATALSDNMCAPVAGGSFFINDVGTATRVTIVPSSVELNISLGLEPIPGPGAAGAYGFITGWVRTDCKATVTVKIPWVTTYETWWDTANGSLTAKHCLFTANATNGRSIGFRCPRLLPIGQRPNIPENVNGQTYTTVQFECDEGATVTSDLTKALFVLFS